MKNLISYSILIIICLTMIAGCSIETEDQNLLVTMELPSTTEIIIIAILFYWLFKKEDNDD